MAKVRIAQSGSIFNANVVYGQLVAADAARIVINAGSLQFVYSGNFTYDNAGNVFGKLTGWTTAESGVLAISVTGLDMSANLAYQLIQSGQALTFLQTAFAGNDTVSLTPGTHTIDGFGGYNIVIEPSNYASYAVTPTLVSGAGSSDALFNFQGIQFADGFYDTQLRQFFPVGTGCAALDMTTGGSAADTPHAYHGPVAGLQSEFISITPDKLNISVATPNWFIHSGSGDDAIAVRSGTNVLDGSTGSNFLVGGTGDDTFFIDDRHAPADIWSTLVNFNTGDAATIWGVSSSNFAVNWADNEGAAGYQGLTLHATAPGMPTASATIVGYTKADLTNGRLSVSFGQVGGDNYMYVHGN